MAGVVDTSVLFAALHKNDRHHAKAAAMLAGHLGLEVPPAVFAETETTIRKKAGLDVARATLPAFLKGNPHIGVMDADLHPAAMGVWQRHGRLSYTDCHAIAGALLLGDELITLDERQAAVWRQERTRD